MDVQCAVIIVNFIVWMPDIIHNITYRKDPMYSEYPVVPSSSVRRDPILLLTELEVEINENDRKHYFKVIGILPREKSACSKGGV
jgi:hypothetical protein